MLMIARGRLVVIYGHYSLEPPFVDTPSFCVLAIPKTFSDCLYCRAIPSNAALKISEV
jgi:hypothetical protein